MPNSTAPGYKKEYHPNRNRRAPIRRVDDPSHVPLPSSAQPNPEPWSPFFTTRGDFLVSEIIIEGSLNKHLSDKLLEIFELCRAGKERVTLSNFSEVETAWDRQLAFPMRIGSYQARKRTTETSPSRTVGQGSSR